MTVPVEQIVAHLIEKVERRFYGKYRGFTVDNADPSLEGGIEPVRYSF